MWCVCVCCVCVVPPESSTSNQLQESTTLIICFLLACFPVVPGPTSSTGGGPLQVRRRVHTLHHQAQLLAFQSNPRQLYRLYRQATRRRAAQNTGRKRSSASRGGRRVISYLTSISDTTSPRRILPPSETSVCPIGGVTVQKALRVYSLHPISTRNLCKTECFWMSCISYENL